MNHDKDYQIRDFKKGDSVEVLYIPTATAKEKTFRGDIIKVKNKHHLSSITIRSRADILSDTIEIELPIYRKDVKIKMIRMVAHTTRKNQYKQK